MRIKSLIAFALGLLLCSCTQKEVEQDTSPITVYVVSQRDPGFAEVAGHIKEELGIDLEFVFCQSSDMSNQATLDFANNNSRADIVVMGAKLPDRYLEGSCIDFVDHVGVVSRFPYRRIKELSSESGHIYQIPINSRLVGITYNETLLNEHGWKLPKNYADMLDLKGKCERAGVQFAVTNMSLSGTGILYLLHLMGAEWINTIDGNAWFEKFLAGTEDVEPFRQQSEYFRKWVENGLFGTCYGGYREVAKNYSTHRALFAYDLNNGTYTGYDGPQLDENGNPTGAVLHDVYKMMPWISESGTNNCFSLFDTQNVSIDKRLLAPDKKDKLAKALSVVEYLLGPEYGQNAAEEFRDVYLTTNDFEIGEDRLYAAYASDIEAGFIQPWYYSRLIPNNIVETGIQSCSYIMKSTMPEEQMEKTARSCVYTVDFDAGFDSIFDTFERTREVCDEDILFTIEKPLDFYHTARLVAVSGALALQEELKALGGEETVDVALVPYARDRRELKPWKSAIACNTQLYPGKLEKAMMYILVPQSGNNVSAVRMSGQEIKQLLENGYSPYEGDDFAFPYLCVTKDGEELKNDAQYLVAVVDKGLDKGVYDGFVNSGKVVAGSTLVSGLSLLGELHPVLDGTEFSW